MRRRFDHLAKELARLPPRAHERAVAEHILLDLQHALTRIPNPTPEQQERIVTVRRSWEDARKEGRLEGRAEGRADALLAVLAARRIPVPAATRKRILAEEDLPRLRRWLQRAASAASIE